MNDAYSQKPFDPAYVWKQYRSGTNFKSGLGTRGMYYQSKMNERYFVGDQWYGVNCGNSRPLIRHNVIKRIGEYKMAVISATPISVNYSAEGVPNTVGLKSAVAKLRGGMVSEFADEAANAFAQFEALAEEPIPTDEEVNLVMSAMSDYYRVTSERVKFQDIREQALRNSYISGTGIVYTWWDDSVKTGLYANEERTAPVTGDIQCEVLDAENVYFGDPNLDDVQKQPFIIVSQRKSASDLKREARKYGVSEYEVEQIAPDSDTGYEAGQMSENEPPESKKATVLTKFWKEYQKDGSCRVMAVKVCRGATVRPKWDLRIRLYPFAKFNWERRRNCAYGESEVTYLIPNQIAINRMVTASVWAVMMMGMPIMVVNQDVTDADTITNEPGQIIRVNGGVNDVQAAIRYVNPPNFSPNFDGNVQSLIANTLSSAGANDAALGDMRPENTSAIIALREAATMPLQQVQNRYYSFCEDIARVWQEFWIMKYGKRALKVEDDSGTWYLPFDGERYKDLAVSARIDVGASNMWSEVQSMQTLDGLLQSGVIDAVQYLSRLPKGVVPGVNKLITEIQQRMQTAQAAESGSGPAPQGGSPALDASEIVSMLPEEMRQQLSAMPLGQSQAAIERAMQAAQNASPESMPTGTVF